MLYGFSFYFTVVEQGEITWNEEEEFEVEQILDYVEEDVSCSSTKKQIRTCQFYLIRLKESICL